MNWEQLKQSSLEDITAWAESQPWCQAMSDCAQDAEWHSEGDVWTHTKMVLEQLLELDEWPSLAPNEQIVLIFTALFHDVAKPLTTEVDPETGRVRSPKHAVKGEHVARSVLRDLGCDLTTREEIARLVRYHGRPAFLLERDEPTHEVARLSWLVNNRLLYLFALADTRGRDTDSMTRPEENLHYWKLMAEEAGCYDQPYPFATDHARFTFFRLREPNLHYVPHEDFSCTVTLMAGLPGSGKDTWLSRNRSDLPIVSLDDIRSELDVEPTDNQGAVAQLAKERCRELLRAKKSFAFNATNTMIQTRGRWLDLFADYNAQIEVVYLEPPFENLLRQNQTRSKAVPEPVIHKLADKCEPPTWLECHSLVIEECLYKPRLT
ncbi:AAA family ATPase [Fuerstiella marisgermanici]|uniref:Polynucleotide kinase n=1 Tax=Fuerstiella marisgermanici TaxID=1891926 RepID=A0A1P8W927_9PLAN|nr:AAA family ATPase [Fuerstiella marisgermanici]APZ90549.1 polynucleotide kinase [Fuerstiella marisgermanici]